MATIEIVEAEIAETVGTRSRSCDACGRSISSDQQRVGIRRATYHEECRRAWASFEAMPRPSRA